MRITVINLSASTVFEQKKRLHENAQFFLLMCVCGNAFLRFLMVGHEDAFAGCPEEIFATEHSRQRMGGVLSSSSLSILRF